MVNVEPYVKRPVKFIRQLHIDDCRLKIYGISAESGHFSDDFVNISINEATPYLPTPANTENRYGVGFMIIHRGTLRNWLLLHWWEHGDILCHKLFSSPLNDPLTITMEQELPAIACVHELRIIDFESQAWMKTVLRHNGSPSLDDYMNSEFVNDD